MRRFDGNAGSMARPIIPPSPELTSSAGWASTRLAPPIHATTRPTRSVMSMVPSGANARSHGRFSPVANDVTVRSGVPGGIVVVVPGSVGAVTHDAAAINSPTVNRIGSTRLTWRVYRFCAAPVGSEPHRRSTERE